MAIEYPQYQPLSVARTSLGEIVRASDYRDIIGQCNTKYAVSGARAVGIVWPDRFQTSSATFTATDDKLFRDLTTWQPIIRAVRQMDGQTSIQVRAFLQNAELSVDVVNADTQVTAGVMTLSQGATSGWVVEELDTTSDVVTFRFRLKSLGGVGYMWCLSIREAVLEAPQPVQSTEGTRGSYPRITLINTYPDGPDEFDSDYPEGYNIIT